MKIVNLIIGLVLLVFMYGMLSTFQQNVEAQQKAQQARERAKHPEPWITSENGVTTYDSQKYLNSQRP